MRVLHGYTGVKVTIPILGFTLGSCEQVYHEMERKMTSVLGACR